MKEKNYDKVNKAFINYYRINRELMTFSERLFFDNIHNFVLNHINGDVDDEKE